MNEAKFQTLIKAENSWKVKTTPKYIKRGNLQEYFLSNSKLFREEELSTRNLTA